MAVQRPRTEGSRPPLGAEDADLPVAPAAVRAGGGAELLDGLRGYAAQVLEIEPCRLPADRPLSVLGLDSLAAAELSGTIAAALGIEVSAAELLAGPTLEELAAEAARRQTAAGAGGPRARDIAAMTPPPAPAAAAATADQADQAAARGPLSWGQRALWLLDRMAPGNPAYIIAGAGRITGAGGALDVGRLRQAVANLVGRHAALRTVFAPEGAAAVRVVRREARFELVEEDAAAWSEARVEERVAEHAHRPFDLERGPLLRVALLHRPEGPRDGPLMVLAVHHLAADFGSLEVLLRELASLYRGQTLPAATATYDDVVRREAELLAGGAGERLAAWWRAALPAGAPPLELPADRPRPPVPSFRGGARVLRLSPELTARLAALGRLAGTTPFMTLLAGFMALLHRASGQAELRIGVPHAGRNDPELAGVVGYLANPVVVRGDLAGDPAFGELLARVRETALAAFARHALPFPLLAEQLGERRDPSRPPVFQAMCVLYRERGPGRRGLGGFALGVPGSNLDLGGLALASVRLPRRAAQVDLTLLAAEIDGGLAWALQYNGDLFDAATAERLLGRLRTLLAGALAGTESHDAGAAPPISALALLAPEERQQLREWNDTAAAFGPALCLHELVERQARRTPAAVAVTEDRDDGGDGVAGAVGGMGGRGGRGGSCESLTFGELNARANLLARRLRALGVGPETLVAVAAERSVALAVGLLAILKAGGAYLPLDPDDPVERLRHVLADTRAPVVLAQGTLAARLGLADGGGSGGDAASAGAATTLRLDDPAAPWCAPQPHASGAGAADLAGLAHPDNLAYVIFTSGSTGRPKGTMNTHRGIVNRLLWMQQRYRLAAGDRVLQKTPTSFDVSVWELFWPLAEGACLVMARPGAHRDGSYLARAIASQQITTLHFVPSMLRAFLAALPGEAGGPGRTPPPPARLLPSLRQVMSSGEALPADLERQCCARLAAALHNLYGPTEAAVDVTSWACDPESPRGAVPIGRPVANTRIHLLDRQGQEVPIGVPGELHIGGVQVGRGYLRRPDLTAERFTPDPFAGETGAGGPPGARQFALNGAPGPRLYRTGDVARYLPDGAVEYLGRADQQVKVRGVRVELGEIEAALARQPGVREAAVLAAGAPGAAAETRLAAYVVAAGPSPPSPAELREALARELPDAMMPAGFAFVAALPRTPSGKLDRKRLAAAAAAGGPAGTGPAATGGAGEAALPAPRWGAAGEALYVAPRTPDEAVVARLFGEALGLDGDGAASAGGRPASLGGGPAGAANPASPAGLANPAGSVEDGDGDRGAGAGAVRIGAGDNFFALGGHSLSGARLLARVRERLGVDLPLRALFEAPTPAALAERIRAARASARPTAPDSPRDEAPLRQDAPGARLPLSSGQRRLWLLAQREPRSAAYNIAGAVRIEGPLDVAALSRALDAVVGRHEPLRTRFAPPLAQAARSAPAAEPSPRAALGGGASTPTGPGRDDPAGAGERAQIVVAPYHLPLPVVDLALLPGAAAEREAERLAGAAARLPFDLAVGRLLRARLLRLAPRRHRLLVILHHIVSDGHSHEVLLGDLAAFHDRRGPALPALAFPYAGWAAWERRRLAGERLDELLAYWRVRLAGAAALQEALELPADRPRPARGTARGGQAPIHIPAGVVAALDALGLRRRATRFMVVLAALDALLYRYTGATDLLIGAPVANRERPGAEHLVGFFANTLALRTSFADHPTFEELVARVREATLLDLAHQDLPLDVLLEQLAPRGGRGAAALLPVVLA
ncbi:MAG TPA: amino acid adenylation domain-containing protein, partial [Thermoanaerobaculia bacterium]|nr:amino acid adenylation domain-containing protein [Thermoanaerobaculia bacterium]